MQFEYLLWSLFALNSFNLFGSYIIKQQVDYNLFVVLDQLVSILCRWAIPLQAFCTDDIFSRNYMYFYSQIRVRNEVVNIIVRYKQYSVDRISFNVATFTLQSSIETSL